MPFTRIAEQLIQEALAEGEFDNLPNAGRPLNLDDYFSAPPDLRMAYSILKNAKCVPTEVDLLQSIARLNDAIDAASDPAMKQPLQRNLVARRTELAILLERRRRAAR